MAWRRSCRRTSTAARDTRSEVPEVRSPSYLGSASRLGARRPSGRRGRRSPKRHRGAARRDEVDRHDLLDRCCRKEAVGEPLERGTVGSAWGVEQRRLRSVPAMRGVGVTGEHEGIDLELLPVRDVVRRTDELHPTEHRVIAAAGVAHPCRARGEPDHIVGDGGVRGRVDDRDALDLNFARSGHPTRTAHSTPCSPRRHAPTRACCPITRRWGDFPIGSRVVDRCVRVGYDGRRSGCIRREAAPASVRVLSDASIEQ